jgi:hypothetical protein
MIQVQTGTSIQDVKRPEQAVIMMREEFQRSIITF